MINAPLRVDAPDLPDYKLNILTVSQSDGQDIETEHTAIVERFTSS